MTCVVALCLPAMPLGAQEVVDLLGGDRRLSADFEEVYRIGSFDGALWETFGAIAGTAFDAQGNLYVLDRQASRITMVDSEGRFVREIGRPGEGPGEFRMPVAFTVMPDGGIVVADLGHRSYQIFDASGEFQRMVRMGGGDVIRIGDLFADPTGNAVISGGGADVIAIGSGPDRAPERARTRRIDRLSLDGEEVVSRTIVEGWRPPALEGPQRVEAGGTRFQMSTNGARAFEPELLVGVLPNGGVAFADSTTYAIKIAGPSGGVARVLRRAIRPREVTNRMKEAERRRRLAALEEDGGPRIRVMTRGTGGGGASAVGQDVIDEMMRGQIEQLEFFPELPVLMGLATSWTGKIWAQRRGPEPTDPGPIDIMTTEGRYLGTLSAAEASVPDAFGPDGLAAYIERDEFDVPIIVVRRLPAVVY